MTTTTNATSTPKKLYRVETYAPYDQITIWFRETNDSDDSPSKEIIFKLIGGGSDYIDLMSQLIKDANDGGAIRQAISKFPIQLPTVDASTITVVDVNALRRELAYIQGVVIGSSIAGVGRSTILDSIGRVDKALEKIQDGGKSDGNERDEI